MQMAAQAVVSEEQRPETQATPSRLVQDLDSLMNHLSAASTSSERQTLGLQIAHSSRNLIVHEQTTCRRARHDWHRHERTTDAPSEDSPSPR